MTLTSSAEKPTLIPNDAYAGGNPEGTLGAEEELWLADPATMKLAGGAQEILARAPEGHLSGELIDCEIEANTGVHAEPAGVFSDLIGRRRYLLSEADRLGRVLGVSGTHPVGDWREQEIIDKPHYQRLKQRLGWLIRRNNTFALHVHYAVTGPEKAIYMFDRLREYVPHLLALSVNSPFWQSENTDMMSSRVLIFSRSMHRGGVPEPMGSWAAYTDYVDYVHRSGGIDRLTEIWWDVRPQPALGTVEMRASDAQADPRRTTALVALTAALGDAISAEYEAGERRPILPTREIEENKWSAQRHGLKGTFIDHASHESVPTRKILESWFHLLERSTDRDLSGAARLLDEPTEADRQLEVWRETGSVLGVARDVAQRTRATVEGL